MDSVADFSICETAASLLPIPDYREHMDFQALLPKESHVWVSSLASVSFLQ